MIKVTNKLKDVRQGIATTKNALSAIIVNGLQKPDQIVICSGYRTFCYKNGAKLFTLIVTQNAVRCIS